ncbi:MAG: sigma-54 interaction domain-containing protein [Candidatus Rokuibacteriota bacterium]
MRFCGRTAALLDDPRSPAVLEPRLVRIASDSLTNGHAPRPVSDPGVPAFHGIVGRSSSMMQIFSIISKVADGDASVCIYGESGTGKELIARAVHYASARRHGPLITLDCTATPEGLMESQLFGHVKGAFTGAVESRDGVFALAHGGTLFMDELCEMSLALQAKLLRVLQSREFCRVGGTKLLRTNIRLITATNKELKRAVENGSFREDLYYRVAVIMLKVPALRERREDIPLLVEHFLRQFAALYRKPILGIAPSAMDRIVSAPWPGNVRQLQNFIEQAVVLAEGDVLEERDLHPEDQAMAANATQGALQLEAGLPLREVERRYILRTLNAVRGSRTEAARRLGISLRCLQYKLKAYVEDEMRSARSHSDAATPAAPRLATRAHP